ncbi:hypothetical protein ACWEF6_02870 [Amycolatopsis sp. NPDC004772]
MSTEASHLNPVGTVRRDSNGRVAVKTSMGDHTGKGQHVWVVTDENLDRRWLHHVEVNRWTIVQHPTVAEFVAERDEYVNALAQCTEPSPDYHRWQGHAEARRQLSERLGQPTVRSAEVSE